MNTGIKVIDVMTTKPVTMTLDITIEKAASEMSNKDVGSILLTEGNKIKGILTEQDIVRKAVSNGSNCKSKKVSEIMAKKLITISPGKDVYDAVNIMKDHDIRHLPVIEDKKLVGLITLKTVLKIQPQLFELLVDKIQLHHSVNVPEEIEDIF